jgi:hypothetical protein
VKRGCGYRELFVKALSLAQLEPDEIATADFTQACQEKVDDGEKVR